MSTKTNFKRIALVAVAALGLGVLSSVPSSATILNASTSLTTANGTATIALADSTTAGSVTVDFSATAADTMTLTFVPKSKPASSTGYPNIGFRLVDTTSSTGATAVQVLTAGTYDALADDQDSATTVVVRAASSTRAVAKFAVQLDSWSSITRVAGTYTYTIVATPQEGGAPVTANIKTADISITIAALASASKVANAGNSRLWITAAGAGTADEAITSVATASNTPIGYLTVKLRNASNTNSAAESVTVTTTAGQVGTSTNRGRSVTLVYSTDMDVNIYPDGTAGTATITVTTPSVTFATKTVAFYAVAPKTLTTTVLNDTLGTGANAAAIAVKAVDANGIAWAGSLYVYSDTVGVVSNDATECTYDTTDARHECSLTGVTAGTAKITVRDAATVATSTVSATAVTVTVSQASVTNFKLAFDKSSYAPGEKATLSVIVVGADGKSVPANTFANLFTSTGITFSSAAGNGTDTVSGASIQTASLASASSLYTATTPVKTFTVYMPSSGGEFSASATGSTSLPLAAQVKVTSAEVTVSDSGAAALAAVTALATTVASLKTLITTLTNLVLKIQKKVKA